MDQIQDNLIAQEDLAILLDSKNVKSVNDSSSTSNKDGQNIIDRKNKTNT